MDAGQLYQMATILTVLAVSWLARPARGKRR